MFSEIRVSTVGSNGGGEGVEEERGQRREDEGGRRYLEVSGSRHEGNEKHLVIGSQPTILVAKPRRSRVRDYKRLRERAERLNI